MILINDRGCDRQTALRWRVATSGHATIYTGYLYSLSVCMIVWGMTRSSPASNSPSAAALAAELRISLGKLVRRVREQAHPGDFTSAQKSVLLRLDRDGPATVSALARAESVRPQSMRITVAGLEAMKAISGKPDPNDGRQTLVDLTPAFRKTLRESRAAKEDWLVRALQAQLSPKEQDELAAAVKLLERLADF
ncbi:MarR family winged helix-turn-helix transcriptional regulator [Luteibacter jiangsuensis]